jgi:hypothetical protein
VAPRAHKRPATGLIQSPERARPTRRRRSAALASNIAQNYPYSSESEQERATAIERALAGNAGLAEKVKAESLEPGSEPRWWVWKCTTPGCPGLLHTAGFARNARGVYTLCDTCGQTYLR